MRPRRKVVYFLHNPENVRLPLGSLTLQSSGVRHVNQASLPGLGVLLAMTRTGRLPRTPHPCDPGSERHPDRSVDPARIESLGQPFCPVPGGRRWVHHRPFGPGSGRSEEHTSELQSHSDLVCRLLLEKKKKLPPCDKNRQKPRTLRARIQLTPA